MSNSSSQSFAISFSISQYKFLALIEEEIMPRRTYIGNSYFHKMQTDGDVYTFSIPGRVYIGTITFPEGYTHWRQLSIGWENGTNPRTIWTFKTGMFGRDDEFHHILLPFLRYLILMYGEG